MALLQQCPHCHRRWSLEEKDPSGKKVDRNVCGKCDYDLGKGRSNQKVPFYVVYFIKEGGKYKQRSEFAGYKLRDARASSGKRRGQKRENRILEIQPEYDQTWAELAAKYLEFPDVKEKASYPRIKSAIDRFIETFGDQLAREFKPQDLMGYQEELLDKYEASTVHQDRLWVQAMVNRADDNEEIHPKVPRAFRRAKKVRNKKTGKPFRVGDNVKGRGFTVGEYVSLIAVSPEYLQDLITVAMNLGLRSTEYFKLRWKHIDLKRGLIEIPEGLVKRAPGRSIPINGNIRPILEKIPRGKPDEPIFRGRWGKPLTQAPKKALAKACKDAGIEYGDDVVYLDESGREKKGFSWRDIRVGVQSNMEAAGVGEKYQKYFAGHTLEGIDKHYFRPEYVEEQMAKYTVWLDTEVEKVKIQKKFIVKSIENDVNQPVSDEVVSTPSTWIQ